MADGHGTNGHLVSKHIKKALVSILEFEDKRLVKYRLKDRNDITSVFQLSPKEDQSLFSEYTKTLLLKTFKTINNQIETQKNFDCSLSGSTLIIAIISKEYVITANCGDSRCILYDKNGQVIFESKDHKPDRDDERERIECQYKGKVRQCKAIK